MTLARDAVSHRYIAGHDYACVRVDLRGSGESEGVLRDEYLQQEIDDGVEVIAWLASQGWCDCNVGMIGISWGGFNALQIAAHRPPELRAVVSVASSDDRYAAYHDYSTRLARGILSEGLQDAGIPRPLLQHLRRRLDEVPLRLGRAEARALGESQSFFFSSRFSSITSAMIRLFFTRPCRRCNVCALVPSTK
jgi:putative CocE/NonD family hydrolase